MSESRHSPAPWHLDDRRKSNGGCGASINVESGIAWVASVMGKHADDDNGTFPTDEECTANARLIARAPDLLAENERLRDALEMAEKELRLCNVDAEGGQRANTPVARALADIRSALAARSGERS